MNLVQLVFVGYWATLAVIGLVSWAMGRWEARHDK